MDIPERQTIAVIPARYASTRFPGKPLARLAGKPMIQHVWERCQESGAFSEVFVATEDSRIMDAVAAFGGQAVMTSALCASGTDRVAEVALQHPEAAIVVNVQGDEPLVDPDSLRLLVGAFDDESVRMATLIRPLQEEERSNPNVVKAIIGLRGDALYFSRHDIPYQRDPSTQVTRYAHLGLYGYRREILMRFSKLKPTPLEDAEKLEQLRALENGIPIRCVVTPHATVAVDTPEDLAHAERVLLKSSIH